jgi:hypothetical protein
MMTRIAIHVVSKFNQSKRIRMYVILCASVNETPTNLRCVVGVMEVRGL